jgi:DNA repair ATPase RecN
VLLGPTRTKQRAGDADDEDYHQWGSVLDKDHILYRAYEKLNVDHKQRGTELITDSHNLCLVTIPTLKEKLSTMTDAHRDCPRKIESLTTQLKTHDACANEIESLTTKLKEHDACANNIKSVRDEYKRCSSELTKLRAEHEGHSHCAEVISNLRAELKQLTIPEQHVDIGEAYEGLPWASESETRNTTLAQALARVESDVRYVLDFIARIFEQCVHREDANI